MIREASDSGNAPEAYFEGLEIGSVSMKWVRRSGSGETVTRIEPHGGNPRKSIQKIIETHSTDSPPIVVTGQSASVLLDLPYRSETECLEKALKFHALKPDMLISLGGENFCVYPMKDGLVKNIITTSKCAAGTGEFIVQQFQRMGMRLEEGLESALNGRIVQLATRCSVHCKSDATHKLNKGECSPGDIAASLIHDLVKKVEKMIEGAQWPTGRIVISGGVTRNKLFVDGFQGVFTESEVWVLPESPFLEAFGACLYAAELDPELLVRPRDKWLRNKKSELETLAPLKEAEKLLDYRVQRDTDRDVREGGFYILGVDAGSTTTKAVLLNVESKAVDAYIYLKTLGNPVYATKKCLKELLCRVGHKKINIIQAGVTGSGRGMVSVYLDNCQSFNEILAHARAAADELPEVDTVFEIGGQDSKFISFLKGIPVDYAMNEGCSAGTGSFIEESSSVDMGVGMEEISRIAEAGINPIAFGERCAAFINTDLRNALQQGAGREDVIAGLAYSIADNYISRIAGTRHIGENLLFLGGVALNKAVAMAIAARTGKKIVVPPHPELMGSVGAALMVNRLLKAGDIAEKRYDLENLAGGKMEEKGSFRCNSCESSCEIRKIGVRSRVYPFGGLCARYEIIRHQGNDTKDGQDLVAVRNKMMFEEFGPVTRISHRGTIGLPMALTAFELFPFFAKLIGELGYKMVLSEPSKEGNSRARAPMCYPCEIAHGAVFDLLNRDVDFILIPRVIEIRAGDEYLQSYTCPSTSVIPDIMMASFENLGEKILCPHLGFSKDFEKVNSREIEKMASRLSVSKASARKALGNAIDHFEAFRRSSHELGEKKLNELGGEPAVIIAGRPYVTSSPEVNLSLPRKIASKGYNVIPADMLPRLNTCNPSRDVWHFTQQITNAVAYARRYPNLYLCLISCFSCGPDAEMYHYFRQELSDRIFCYLEIDSHTSHTGFETRVGAFLDIIEENRHRL